MKIFFGTIALIFAVGIIGSCKKYPTPQEPQECPLVNPKRCKQTGGNFMKNEVYFTCELYEKK